jgi:hypothetical protein
MEGTTPIGESPRPEFDENAPLPSIHGPTAAGRMS